MEELLRQLLVWEDDIVNSVLIGKNEHINVLMTGEGWVVHIHYFKDSGCEPAPQPLNLHVSQLPLTYGMSYSLIGKDEL